MIFPVMSIKLNGYPFLKFTSFVYGFVIALLWVDAINLPLFFVVSVTAFLYDVIAYRFYLKKKSTEQSGENHDYP